MKSHFLSSKGILLGLAASFLLCAGNASAQDYIGGSFSFNGNSNKTTMSSTSHRTGGTVLSIAPDLGWFLGDKWAVGVRPWVGFGSNTDSDENLSKTFTLGVNPYARYQVLGHNRFGLWAEADPKIGYTQNKSEDREHVWTSTSRATTYGIELVPVLTYQLNSRISLESRLNLFSFSMMGSHTESGSMEQNAFNCGLGASTKDVLGTLGDISIGFLYKF